MDLSPPPADLRPVLLERLQDRGEARHLGPGGTPRLLRVAGGQPAGAPIVFIHGFTGDPANQVVLIEEARARGLDVWVMVYETVGKPIAANALGFAEELSRFARPGREPITIVAHSLGALTLKAALDGLAARPAGLPFAAMRVVSISTPWSGLAIADCTRSVLGEAPTPVLLRDLAPGGPTIGALQARPWPPGVQAEDLVGSLDPLNWLQGPRPPVAPGLAPIRALIAGASHNTVLWDPRTVSWVFEGPGARGTRGRKPGFWRTVLDEGAAVLGLPGAFERRKRP